MSELKRQVAALKASAAVPAAAPLHKGRASLFLDAKKAAEIDTQTVHNAAVNGLMALEQYDAKFAPFFDSLLHASRRDVARQSLSPEENKALGRELDEFILLLAPYMNAEPCHRVMEYLIRRFRVNELNVDALLRAALPYHDTKMFARLVQISSIEHTIWFWLEGVKKSGSPIPRHALATRCTSDPALLTSVLTLVRELAATAGDRSASTVQRIEQLVSFYAAIVIEALSMGKSTNEEFVRTLYPFIISFLTGSYVSGEPDADMDAPTHRQLLTATCMVVTQLVRASRLSSDVLSSLISALCGQNDFSPEVVCTLLAISQHQRVKHIPKKALRSLIGQVDDFLSAVQAQAARYDVGRFTTLFTGSVASVLSSDASLSKNLAALHALHQVFRILPSGGEVRPALRSLLGFLVTVSAGDDKEALLDAAGKVFDAISSKYPRQLDEAVAAISSAAATSGDEVAEQRASKGSGKRSRNDDSTTSSSAAAEVDAMLDVLRQIFTGARSVFVPLAEAGNRSLYLSLQDTSAQIRIRALEAFGKLVTEISDVHDEAAIEELRSAASVALQRFADAEADVVIAACQPPVLTGLLRFLDEADVQSAIAAAANAWYEQLVKLPQKATKVLVALLNGVTAATVLELIKDRTATILVIVALFPGVQQQEARVTSEKHAAALRAVNVAAVTAASHSGVAEFGRISPAASSGIADYASRMADVLIDKFLTKQDRFALQYLVEGARICTNTSKTFAALAAPLANNLTAVFKACAEKLFPMQEAFQATRLELADAVGAHESSPVDQLGSALTRLALPLLFRGLLLADKTLNFYASAPAGTDNAAEQQDLHHSSEYLLAGLEALMRVMSLLKGTTLAKHSMLYVSLEHTVAPFAHDDPTAQVLVCLLSLRHVNARAALESAFHVLCANQPCVPLLRVASFLDLPKAECESLPLQSSFRTVQQLLDEDAASVSVDGRSSASLRIPVQARARALLTLSAYIQGGALAIKLAGQPSVAASANAITDVIARDIASIVPVVVIALSSQHQAVRRAALEVLQKVADAEIPEVVPVLEIELPSYDLKVEVTDNKLSNNLGLLRAQVKVEAPAVSTVVPHLRDLQTLARILCAKSTDILVDNQRSALDYLVGHIIFSDDSRTVESLNVVRPGKAWSVAKEKLRNYLLWFCVLYSVSAPDHCSVLLDMSRGSNVNLRWPFVRYMLGACIATQATPQVHHIHNSLVSSLCDIVALAVPEGAAPVDEGVRAEVVDWFRICILANDELRTALLTSFNRNLGENLALDQRAKLYSVLLELAVHPSVTVSRDAVRAALKCIPMQLEPVYKIVLAEAQMFTSAVEKADEEADGNSNNNDSSSSKRARSNLAYEESTAEVEQPDAVFDLHLQRLGGILECLQSCTALVDESDEELENDPAVTIFVRPLLQLLTVLNAEVFEEGIHAEYVKVVIMEIADSFLRALDGKELTLPREPKKSGKKRKSSAAQKDEQTPAEYDASEIVEETRQVVLCVKNAKTSQLRTIGVRLFTTLAKLCPMAIVDLVMELVTTISHSVVRTDSAVGSSLLKQVMDCAVNVMVAYSRDHPELSVQRIMHIFAKEATRVPVGRRTATFTHVVNMVGDQSLGAMVAVLLAEATTTVRMPVIEAKVDTIVLSRNAARAAARSKETDPSTEILELAENICRRSSAQAQVHGMTTVSKIVQCALLHVAEVAEIEVAEELLEELAEEMGSREIVELAYPVGDEEEPDTPEQGPLHVNVVDMCELVFGETKKDEGGIRRFEQYAIFMLSAMEFIHSHLESRVFHEQLVPLADNQSQHVQAMFLIFSEELLEIMRVVSVLQSHTSTSTAVHKWMLVVLKKIAQVCLQILDTLQRLLDLPSFMVILQELLRHEEPVVRRHALVMFNARIDSLTEKESMSPDKQALFMDMFQELLEVLRTADYEAMEHKDANIQSALLSIDILARRFGAVQKKEFTAALTDICNVIEKVAPAAHQESSLAALNILSSCYLCVATMCAVLGAAVFPKLPVFFPKMLESFESTLGGNTAGSDSESEGVGANLKSLQACIGVVRTSVLSAVSSVCAYLPQFVHPYLLRVFKCMLHEDILSSNDGALRASVDQAFQLIGTGVPTRLLFPFVAEQLDGFMAMGVPAAVRVVGFMERWFTALSRDQVTKNLNACTALLIASLDYRRVYAEEPGQGQEVDAAAVSLALALCMKLTENELRGLFVRLCEWRLTAGDAEEEAADGEQAWRTMTRKVAFYRLTRELAKTFKGIFVPFFGYIWMDAKAELEAVSSKAQQLQQSQKRKKKSRASTSPLDESTQGLLVEMRTMVEFLVMAFNECFNSDVDGFTDKARYDAIMPALVSAVAIRPVFASDEQHVAFVKDRLAPCVASMAQCVGKDVMWKPMNHQVLMFTRDDSATVKLAAIHVIYKLFVEVGDEYLILLPECLPYLSELLEDSDDAVTSLTSELIKYIEDLSGEKLDEYLS